MIFHFSVSNLRKQRTIMASRFSADAAARGIGDGNPNDFWRHPISGNQYARGQAYPDPQNHYLGMVDPEVVQPRFLPRVRTEGVQVGTSWPEDGLDRLKREIDNRTTAQPPVTQITRTFWEQLAATDQVIGNDLDFRWHQYAVGARVAADYAPRGQTFERLQGPIPTHFYRESGSWHLPEPDMWWDLTQSAPGLSDLQKAFFELSQDPAMNLTGEAFFRWFRH